MGTLKCKWCGRDSLKETVDECDPCWHLRYAINRDPSIARRMLGEISEQEDSPDKEVYCQKCSEAGTADMPIYHLPPACR